VPDLDILRQLAHDVGADTALKLLDIFQADADKRIAAISDDLQNADDGNGNVSDLRIQAHSLKGLCNTYGAVDGGEAARVLQEACEQGNAAEIRTKAKAAIDTISQDIKATLKAAQMLKGA